MAVNLFYGITTNPTYQSFVLFKFAVLYHKEMDMMTAGGVSTMIQYLDGGVVYIKDRAADQSSAHLYHAVTDRLGSFTKVLKGNGTAVFKANYDEWGKQTVTTNTIGFFRGYTGHEMLPEFGLINMNGRMYDPLLARFLSPDDYVQMPMSPQGFNRYSYCMNNPMRYTDPSGELAWFVPIIAGAVIGSAMSAATYSAACLITGSQWNSKSFWKSVGMGALGGAIGGAFGSVAQGSSALTSLSNNFGYNLFGQISTTVITNTVFGQKTNFADLGVTLLGSVLGSRLPTFKAKSGNLFKNAVEEAAFNTLRGTEIGLARGAVSSVIHNDPNRFLSETLGGAISGLSKSLLHDVLLGLPEKYETNVKGLESKGTFRKGSLLAPLYTMFKGAGLTLGKHLHLFPINAEQELYNHEWYHGFQISQLGLYNFYYQIFNEYLSGYNSSHLEYEADYFAK